MAKCVECKHTADIDGDSTWRCLCHTTDSKCECNAINLVDDSEFVTATYTDPATKQVTRREVNLANPPGWYDPNEWTT
jgi:hypothetical protein